MLPLGLLCKQTHPIAKESFVLLNTGRVISTTEGRNTLVVVTANVQPGVDPRSFAAFHRYAKSKKII